ncbi:MAG TPA: hypothetical protein VFC16_00620 [Nakamurella sp.]|nr:hypothetical protein [Nakamurella sp.]
MPKTRGLPALYVAEILLVALLMVPPLALASLTDEVWLVLLALAEFAFAAYAAARIGARARRALLGPTGYVCRHCGTDMTVSLCARGHTHEALVPSGGGDA